MKLSNKILIGFFGFIFLYMTAAFTELGLRGTSSAVNVSNSVSESVDIDKVTYLVVDGVEQSVIIIGSDKARLEVYSPTGDLLHKLQYTVSGDTLTLGKLEAELNGGIWISVFVPKNSLENLVIRNASVNIEQLEQNQINISQNQGRVNMYSGNIIETFNLEASSGAYFSLSNSQIDTLSLQLESSQITMHTLSPAKLLKGSLKNNSYLRITAPGEVQFTKDETSRVQFN